MLNMIRTSVSKFKQACVLSYMPRMLRGDTRYPIGRPDKQSHGGQRRHKSTNSTSDSQGETEAERCKKIIERTFEPNPPCTELSTELNEKEANQIALAQIITPQLPPSNESHREKCQRIIKQIFDEDVGVEEVKNDVDPVHIPLTETLQATTAKNNEEKLSQKIEVIEETPLVEAQKQKVEGFNAPPKVLGSRRKRKSIEKHNTIFNCTIEKPIYTRRRFAVINCSSDKSKVKETKVPATFDELAKRCLDAPSGQIDERLLKEIEKLGVPPTGRRSKNRVDDSEFIQADVMKRPRRPVAKTEIDIISLKKIDVDKHRCDLPPPFELAAEKLKPETPKVGVFALETEKLQPCLMSEIDRTSFTKNSEYKENHPPQKLLSHMAATVMSDETVKDKVRGTLIENQNKPKPFELSDSINETLEESTKELDNREGSDDREEDVGAKDVAQKPTSHYETETKGLEHLLQSRAEHLESDKTKPFDLVKEGEFNLTEGVNETKKQEITQDNIAILQQAGSHLDDDPLIIFKEAPPKTENVTASVNTQEVCKFNMTESEMDTENVNTTSETEAFNKQPNYNMYKPERIIPGQHNLMFEGKTSFPDPGVVVRDYEVETSNIASPINPDTYKYSNQLNPDTYSNQHYSNQQFVQSDYYPQYMHYLQGRMYDENSQHLYQFSVKRLDTPIPAVDTSKPPGTSEKHPEQLCEEPVIVAETGRMKQNTNFYEQELILDHVFSATNEKRTSIPSKYIPIQNLISPLIDKGTMATKETLQMSGASSQSKPDDDSVMGKITHFTKHSLTPQEDYISDRLSKLCNNLSSIKSQKLKPAEEGTASKSQQMPAVESPKLNAESKSVTGLSTDNLKASSVESKPQEESITGMLNYSTKDSSDKSSLESAKSKAVVDNAKDSINLESVDPSKIKPKDQCVTGTTYVDKNSLAMPSVESKPENENDIPKDSVESSKESYILKADKDFVTETKSNLVNDSLKMATVDFNIIKPENECATPTQPQVNFQTSSAETRTLRADDECVTNTPSYLANDSLKMASVESHVIKPENECVTGNPPQDAAVNMSSADSARLKAENKYVAETPSNLASDSLKMASAESHNIKPENESVARIEQLSTLDKSSTETSTLNPETAFVTGNPSINAKDDISSMVPPKLNAEEARTPTPPHIAKEDMSSVELPKFNPQEEFIRKTTIIQRNPYTHAEEMPCLKSYTETLSLTELVKKVRERSQMENAQTLLKVKYQSDVQVDPVEGKCGKKPTPCPPPAPVCPPPPPPPCPPTDPPCPKPCKPACTPGCPPAPCPPKPPCPPPEPACPPPKPCPPPEPPCPPPKPPCAPCPDPCSPPEKKSPCDKFKCTTVQLHDVLSLLVYLGPQLHLPVNLIVPILACALKCSENALPKTDLIVQDIIRRFNNLCSIVLLVSLKEEVVAVEATLADAEVKYARTYDPWSPIPSWPIPVKQEKRKLVCPKDGCKHPRLSEPCKDVNPCINFPKPNSLTKRPFSIIEFVNFLMREYVEPIPKN